MAVTMLGRPHHDHELTCEPWLQHIKGRRIKESEPPTKHEPETKSPSKPMQHQLTP